jgi:uncharacterized protein YggL (DUF469 family)
MTDRPTDRDMLDRLLTELRAAATLNHNGSDPARISVGQVRGAIAHLERLQKREEELQQEVASWIEGDDRRKQRIADWIDEHPYGEARMDAVNEAAEQTLREEASNEPAASDEPAPDVIIGLQDLRVRVCGQSYEAALIVDRAIREILNQRAATSQQVRPPYRMMTTSEILKEREEKEREEKEREEKEREEKEREEKEREERDAQRFQPVENPTAPYQPIEEKTAEPAADPHWQARWILVEGTGRTGEIAQLAHGAGWEPFAALPSPGDELHPARVQLWYRRRRP